MTVPKLSHVLAFDVGGSHATAGIVDLGSLTISCANSCAIDSDGTADSILDALQVLGNSAIAKGRQLGVSVDGIGVAAPGPFDYERGVSLLRHKYSSLYQMDLKREFEGRFGLQRDKIAFLNDAQAFLLGEIRAGSAKGVQRCIGLTLGTGVGAAFSLGGCIVEEGEDVPAGGEVYCLPWKGHTVEDAISTRAIQNSYRKISGKNRSVRDICVDAPKDWMARAVMQEFGHELGLVLRDICTTFHPEAIVLGGAISRSAHLFRSAVTDVMDSIEGWSGDTLQISALFDDAPLIGAAIRCFQALELAVTFSVCSTVDN